MLLRLAIASLGLFLASTLVEAQAVETAPIMGSQSTEEVVAQPVDDTYRILVIGDALAGRPRRRPQPHGRTRAPL